MPLELEAQPSVPTPNDNLSEEEGGFFFFFLVFSPNNLRDMLHTVGCYLLVETCEEHSRVLNRCA
jgi:hypothetical protein